MDFAPPWTPQQTYTWTGTLNDPDEPHQTLGFTCLAGTAAPTPTAGGAKIRTLDRMRRKGYTMPTGYDPAAMDVPIRFEATVNYGRWGWTPAQIERNIQILEWMWGFGKLYAHGTHPSQGDPPIVQVASFQSNGQSTNLIPPNFHSDGAHDLRWLIANVQYASDSTGCIRGPLGDRRRQDATVSLIEYVAAPGAPTSPAKRQKARGGSSGFRSYSSTSAQDTIAKLCLFHGINSASNWRAVVEFNQARLHIRSYNAHLQRGTKVHIPNSVFTSGN